MECSGTISRAGLGALVTARAGSRTLPVEVTLLSDHASNEPVSRNRLAELAANLPGAWTDSILVVRPRAPWPAVRKITLHLSPDLGMEDGPLPLGSEAVFRVQDVPELKVLDVVCNSQRELEAWFSMPVPVLEIARLSVTPAPHKAIPSYRGISADERGWGYTVARGASDARYEVEVPGDLTDEVGQLITSGATAQAMYAPGTRGRGLSRSVRIVGSGELEKDATNILDTLGL